MMMKGQNNDISAKGFKDTLNMSLTDNCCIALYFWAECKYNNDLYYSKNVGIWNVDESGWRKEVLTNCWIVTKPLNTFVFYKNGKSIPASYKLLINLSIVTNAFRIIVFCIKGYHIYIYIYIFFITLLTSSQEEPSKLYFTSNTHF